MSQINITRAQFTTVPATGGARPFIVHFNPSSLQHTITNTLEENREDHKQYLTKSSAKLTMDLVFDTTDTGEDVRVSTKKIIAFMEPERRDNKKVPPVVLFEWGVFKFQGLVESYRETIDFFSADGVPLRASVNLTLARQEKVFESDDGAGGSDDAQGALPGENAVDVSAGVGGGSATATATLSGNASAGRDIAAANGEESMRFSTGPLTVDASIQLGGPVAFASGGAGLSLGIGGGLSAGGDGGIGFGGGAGFSAGGGIGGGIGVSGGTFGSSGGIGAGAGSGLGFSAGGGVATTGGSGLGVNAGASAGVG